jgi:hypothetical protein
MDSSSQELECVGFLFLQIVNPENDPVIMSQLDLPIASI